MQRYSVAYSKGHTAPMFFFFFSETLHMEGVVATLQGPEASVVSYALRAYMVLMEGMLALSSERAHLFEN